MNPAAEPAIHFSRAICDRLRAAAAAEPTREICGLIGARDGAAVAHYPITNIAPDTARRYHMDPAAQIAAFRAMRLRGESLAAIYHSHPAGLPLPSPRDLCEWSYPDALCLIIGLAGGRPRLRAWRWHRAGFAPVRLDACGDDVPPHLSSGVVWSPIPQTKEIGREEAFFGRADHRLSA